MRSGIMVFMLVAYTSMISAQGVTASVAQTAAQDNNGIISLELRDVPIGSAIRTIASRSGLIINVDPAVLPKGKTVTVHADQRPAMEVLSQVLQGTGLRALADRSGVVTLGLAVEKTARTRGNGIVSGKVVDAKSDKGLSGATVSVGNEARGVTGADGTYRISAVMAGTHTLSVRLVGYAKQSRQVSLGEGATVTADFKLEPSANVLDQVIVTGTAVATELKAVPNAITVITARQIEERGITRIDQLFRGDVPGLFAMKMGSSEGTLLDEVKMFSRGATGFGEFSSDTRITNAIKTYIDGVEVVNSEYLSQIDPKTIERIEILTGPQASTIYGSNAINGVMQIFTKRGLVSRPQLSLSALSGFVENNFSNARTPQHDYDAQLSGIEGKFSYSGGGSWHYIGPWTPAKQLTRLGISGGGRLDISSPFGPTTADITLRQSITKNSQRGMADQTTTGFRETGWWATRSNPGAAAPTDYNLTSNTIGLTLTYNPTSWWSHEFGYGKDASRFSSQSVVPGYLFIDDTTLRFSQSENRRSSLRYNTTTRASINSVTKLTVTVGADAWQTLASSASASGQVLTGSLSNPGVSRNADHNAGAFLQTQLDLSDRLFFTYGLRAEWNPGFGENIEPNYAPRYGFAYTHDLETPFGSLTAKARASYGRATRPPKPGAKSSQTVNDVYGATSFVTYFKPYYGTNIDHFFANPELAPEHQQGGEGGVELYFGNAGSLVVTRYNQTIDGLIAGPVVDSVRTLVPCSGTPCFYSSLDADGYGYWKQYKNLNIGSIRNQGWELQGSVNTGPVTTRGTYSWTKSRTIGVSREFRALFPPGLYPQYQPGASFQYLPEHTYALGMVYTRSGSSVGINATGSAQARNLQDDFYIKHLITGIRLRENRLNMSLGTSGGYVSFNSGYTLVDLTASQRFSSKVEGVLQVENLTDNYGRDYFATYATTGRVSKAGVRIKL